jgi:phosphoribosylamine--glycine ligase
VPGVDDALVADVMRRFVEPTLAELRARGIDYRGVLYAGLMLTPDGPRLVEFNVRFGDPEAQVVLPRLSTDLAGLLAAAAAGDLSRAPAPVSVDHAAVTVVLATEGYPAAPRSGDVIVGLDAAASTGALVFCAGVAGGEAGDLVTAGGRVLAVTGTGPTVAAARDHAYRAAGLISWPGMHHRSDIALEASL